MSEEEFKKKYIFNEEKDKDKDWLGEGGFGSCYKAYVKGTDERRAVKIIDKNKFRENYKKEHLVEPEEKDMKPYFDDLYKEIEYMKIMEGDNKDNVNTVKFYESFESYDKFIVVMELCNMSLLDKFTKDKDKNFTSEEIKELLLQLNNSFKIMHNKKIAHRDLSLDNILIKEDSKDPNKYIAKLTDYGVSKKLTTIKNQLSTKIGKLNYMAPEILKINPENEKKDEYNDSCDLWSLGVMIYLLYFRKYPYTGNKETAIMNQMASLGKGVIKPTDNKQLDSLLKGLLEKNPEKRLNWDTYFSHPFFGVEKKKITNNNNYVIIKVIVRKRDKGEMGFKDIYFLNNQDKMKSLVGIYEENEEINNLKDNDVELYINEEKKPFKKCFKPENEGEYEIKLIFQKKMEDCSYLFSGCDNIKSINLSSFDSSSVTNMRYMLSKCHYLEEIILDNLKTENVTDMNHMFNKCSLLKTIKFPSSFNTKSLKDIECMFNCCIVLKNIDFNNFTIDNVTNMKGLFLRCHLLKKIDLKNFNTSKVKNMGYMFAECTLLNEINIDPKKFITSETTQMSYMFQGCSNLQKINLSSFDTRNTKLLNHMFSRCENITYLDLSTFNIANEAKISNMFDEMLKIKTIKVNANTIANFKNEFKIIESKFKVN